MADEHLRVLVKGLAEASRALKAAPADIRRELPKALRRAVEPALSDARGRAPRASGGLAGSVRIKASQKGALLGSSKAHAGVLEFAHRGRYSSLSEAWGPPPRFLIPAIEAQASRIEATVGDAVQGVLDQAFGGGSL